MNERTGFTRTDVIVLVLVAAGLAAVVLPSFRMPRVEARRRRCRESLNQLAKGMATYVGEYGDNRWFPCPLGRGMNPGGYNGAEWLATLYWTGVVTDPLSFICPASPDDNAEGRQFGDGRAITGRFGTQTVSYAGMHYYSLGKGAAIPADYPPDKPMASDDTQGDVNHGTLSSGALSVLFFDLHVDFRTHIEVDLRTGVGATGEDQLLRELRN